ncbi:MAG: CHAT domain-containing protein [Anaerolineae bacterium]|nr:CHAT domain-containing protein [Anaerolineae bacterium]
MNSNPFADLEIRIFERQEAGYPVEITLNKEQEFPRGYMPADVIPWTTSGNLLNDGKKLLAALLHDSTIRDAWVTVHRQQLPHRIRLRIDREAAELHTLPWESLCENNVLLSASADTPFSRYLPTALPWKGAVKDCSIRILVTISNPADLIKYNLSSLDISVEHQILESIQSSGPQSRPFLIDFLDPPITLERIEDALRQGYNIWHYLGHGIYNPRLQQAMLYLQDNHGQTCMTPDSELSGMLARLKSEIKPHLVFLATCQSATRATDDAFLGLAPKLVSIGVPAVVAMQDFITIETARKFSTTFYTRLLNHGLVDQATNEARSTLLTTERPEAVAPVLFMRLRSGEVWSDEADARGKISGDSTSSQRFWDTLIAQIQAENCVPVIGPRVHEHWLPTPEQLATEWAHKNNYPFLCKTDLARVAQYLGVMVNTKDPHERLCEKLRDELVKRLPPEFQDRVALCETLTEVIQTVGWKQLIAGLPNEAHQVLASIKFPLYLTTNTDGFMTEALRGRGKHPDREICRWKNALMTLPTKFKSAKYRPDKPERPLVYHLFGNDEKPESIVFTEDDYLDYLVNISTIDDSALKYIRSLATESAFLFVGYNLYDWEFRVIMRGLVARHQGRNPFHHMTVQMEESDTLNMRTAREFREEYLRGNQVDIYWGTTAQFIAELREHLELGKL